MKNPLMSIHFRCCYRLLAATRDAQSLYGTQSRLLVQRDTLHCNVPCHRPMRAFSMTWYNSPRVFKDVQLVLSRPARANFYSHLPFSSQ